MTKEAFLKNLEEHRITEQEIINLMKQPYMKAETKWLILTEFGLDAEEVFEFYVENHFNKSDLMWEVK